MEQVLIAPVQPGTLKQVPAATRFYTIHHFFLECSSFENTTDDTNFYLREGFLNLILYISWIILTRAGPNERIH